MFTACSFQLPGDALPRRATVVQYWESMDKLMAYAASRDRAHLPAWRA